MKDSPFMNLALEAAAASASIGEVPVGCVIAVRGRVLVTEGNRTISYQDPTAHAEVLAIRSACRLLGSPYLPEADLFVTLEPCAMCACAISWARIRRVYYAACDPKGGCVDHGSLFYNSSSCFHRPEVYGGLGEKRSQNLLRRFFASRRGPNTQQAAV